jgi:hypothetical protein
MPELNLLVTNTSDSGGTSCVVTQPVYTVTRQGYSYGVSNNAAGTGFMEYGSGTPGSLPFRVDQAGNVTATSIIAPIAIAPLQTVATGNTIVTAAAYGIYPLTATANATGLILPPGTVNAQQVQLINTQVPYGMTFAAPGTSNVADGTSDTVPQLQMLVYTWYNGLWYRNA